LIGSETQAIIAAIRASFVKNSDFRRSGQVGKANWSRALRALGLVTVSAISPRFIHQRRSLSIGKDFEW
jgi:hypothetical protein